MRVLQYKRELKIVAAKYCKCCVAANLDDNLFVCSNSIVLLHCIVSARVLGIGTLRHRNVNDPKFTQKFHQIFIIERANNIKIEQKKFISYIEIHVQNTFTIVRIVFITMSAELVCAKLSQIF